jgi:hypothetical protein
MNAAPMRMPRHRTLSGSAILPRVWATASIASAADAVQQRKRPHCLRLVRASGAQTQAAPALTVPRTQRTIEPGLAFYRKYTEGMLRRYMEMSMQSGRVPSLLGRELFRGKVTSCRVQGFDDVVIFVHDVGRCLEQLDPGAAAPRPADCAGRVHAAGDGGDAWAIAEERRHALHRGHRQADAGLSGAQDSGTDGGEPVGEPGGWLIIGKSGIH